MYHAPVRQIFIMLNALAGLFDGGAVARIKTQISTVHRHKDKLIKTVLAKQLLDIGFIKNGQMFSRSQF